MGILETYNTCEHSTYIRLEASINYDKTDEWCVHGLKTRVRKIHKYNNIIRIYYIILDLAEVNKTL